ncbi:hypothetical protein I6L58_20860 [Enterobacter cancerogenus]|jgi:hypothetical protein|uniref:CdiI immunity protein domain-containing protein n=1 Tax=Enterobacter cancerogenus TaxID=69218 RepID=A0ABX8KMH3_9ENTR|nr:contact-dependent growth inhibition system immunity protein [Enterobacter cancerogenus]QXA49111.1 hypothetical protein I6L58_20860 [Enterobacter cancerogenus]
MDADIYKPCELDNLVVIYFGQDCDIFDADCDFDNLLNEYLTTSPVFSLRMCLANLTEIESDPDGVKIFSERYRHEFDPEGWNMTAQEWLGTVKARLISYMTAKGYSTELSHF